MHICAFDAYRFMDSYYYEIIMIMMKSEKIDRLVVFCVDVA